MLLKGLDLMHSECRLIHTGKAKLPLAHSRVLLTFSFPLLDIRPDNCMPEVEDMDILHRQAIREYANPLPQKQTKHCIIFESSSHLLPHPDAIGAVQLTDFGLATCITEELRDCSISASVHRAPEVILGADWSYPADIWSFGVMVR